MKIFNDENNRGKQPYGDRISRTFEAAKRELDTGTIGRGISRTDDSEQQTAGKTELLGILERVAKERGTWIKNHDDFANPIPVHKGYENEVFLTKDGKDIIKYNNLKLSGNLDVFLNRIIIHNEFAANAPYTILVSVKIHTEKRQLC